MLVEALAGLGRLALRIYGTQRRSTRSDFAAGLAVWMAFGAAAWLLIDPIADADWLSDAAVERIARVLSALALLWEFALLALVARRCHDWGLAGGWALMIAVPPFNLCLIAAALALPGRSAGRFWPRRVLDFE